MSKKAQGARSQSESSGSGARRRGLAGIRDEVSSEYSSSGFPAAEEIPFGQRPATPDPDGRCTIGWRATLEQDDMIRRAAAKVSPRRGGRTIAVSKAQFVEQAAIKEAARVLGEPVPERRVGMHAARVAEACRILGIEPREWKRQTRRELLAAAADAMMRSKR